MDGPANVVPLRHFSDLPDPRAANVRHRLIDLLVMALCATICGADGWDDFEAFAHAKRDWFGTFLDLEHGVPSADTFRRVISRLDPAEFERCFLAWMQSVVELSQGRLVAIDGKSLRRSFERGWDRIDMTHMVSAFVEHNGQVFAQVQAQGKGQELAAIAKLLGLIDLKGATVTIDAIGAQKNIARKIRESGGEYVLAVKDNQPTLHQAIKAELDDMIRTQGAYLPGQDDESIDAGHGRIETRRVWVTDQLSWLKQRHHWPGLRSVAVVESKREVAGARETAGSAGSAGLAGAAAGAGVSIERRYFISSLPAHAKAMAAAIRGHWSIENGLHHVLDVSFREDDSRIRKDHGAQNVSRLRRIALNLLRGQGDKHTKRKSIKGRRKIAGWDHDFLLRLIAG